MEEGQCHGHALCHPAALPGICCFARHLTLHGVTADGVLTLSAILAGTTFATDELFVVMAEVCDDLRRVWPLTGQRVGLGLTLVGDDLGVRARALLEVVVGECRSATEMAMQKLTAIGCVVSAGDCWSPIRGRR